MARLAHHDSTFEYLEQWRTGGRKVAGNYSCSRGPDQVTVRCCVIVQLRVYPGGEWQRVTAVSERTRGL